MATVSKALYDRLLENRPFKFSAEEVNYRDAEGEERCENCVHFYTRKVDGFNVCEIFRDDETDEKGIDTVYACDFHTADGKTFPLLEE